MNVISKPTLLYYVDKYPISSTALLVWYRDFLKYSFNSFNDLKAVYGNASIIANNRVIFNVKGNDFRLIVSINFRKQDAYLIWFGTHKEYDKINAATIEFIDVL